MATTRRGVVSLLVIGFAGFVVYATVASAPESPSRGQEPSTAGAAQSCVEAVRARVPGGSFPFAAEADYEGGALYRVSGTVDSQLQGEQVRRNYECLVRAVGRAFRADSVRVWQSH